MLDLAWPPADSLWMTYRRQRPWFWFQPDKMPSVTYIRTRMGPHIARAGWDPWDYTGFPGVDPSLDRDPRTRVSEWGSMNLAGGLLPDSNHDGTPDGRVQWADVMTAAHGDHPRQ